MVLEKDKVILNDYINFECNRVDKERELNIIRKGGGGHNQNI